MTNLLLEKLFRNLVACWNWKSAILSSCIRSTVYLLSARHHGLASGMYAVVAEICYVGVTAGIYSAMQQAALPVRPRWLSSLLIVVGVPCLSQTVECCIHFLLGTPNLKAATLSIMSFAFFSAAFHLHIMRQGALIVGKDGRPFTDDLRRIPSLVLSFLLIPARNITELERQTLKRSDAPAV